MKKIFYTIFIIFVFLFSFPSSVLADDLGEETIDVVNIQQEALTTSAEIPDLNSRSCVVLDRISGTILFGKNEKSQVKMASTTKIMTAIVVLENTSLDQTVEVSQKSAGTGGSRLGLKTGDKITIRDLLYGLMLCSGNDAAICLAENVAGSVDEFSNKMNAKAYELGLCNTHFESPHGLDSDGHYTTAYELALLSDYALKNPTFLSIVATKNYTVTINGYPKALSNTNELLGVLDGVYGIKTGFTNGANRCLVTACKRGNRDIICVVLGADTKNFRTKDSIKLIEYSFKTYEYFDIHNYVEHSISEWQKNNPHFFFVEKGESDDLQIKLDSSLEEQPIIPLKKDWIDNISTSITIESQLYAPIKEGDLLGKLIVYSGENTIAEFDLVSATNIRKNNTFDYLLNFFKCYPNSLETALF